MANTRTNSQQIGDGTIRTADLADGSVTLAKLADMATASVFYRKTAGPGAPEVQTLATLKSDLLLSGTNTGDAMTSAANLPGGNWVGAQSGSATFGGYTITTASGTYAASGLEVALPAAGTYLISVDLYGVLSFSAGGEGYIVVKLYDATATGYISASERWVVYGQVVNQFYGAGLGATWLVTVASARTIRVHAARFAATTWIASQLRSDSLGTAVMIYHRIY